MSYETIITIICAMLAITVLTVSFRFAHWRNRAEEAEHLSAQMIGAHIKAATSHKQKSYGEAIRKRFDASTLTFAGFNTAAEMDVDTLGHFGMAVKNGQIAKMLDQQAELIRQIDALKGGAK